MDLSKVVIGHVGDTNDLDYLEELLSMGVYLGLDRFGLGNTMAGGGSRKESAGAYGSRLD